MNVPLWKGRDLTPPAEAGIVTAAQAKSKEIVVEPQDRWEVQQSRRPMPAHVETTLTSGLYGDVSEQDRLFSTMVDTWPKLSSNIRTLKSAAGQAPFCVHPALDGDGQPTTESERRQRVVEAALWGMRPDETALEFGAEGMFEELAIGCLWGHTVIQPKSWELRDMPDGSKAFLPRAMSLVDPLHYGYPGSNSDATKDQLMLYDRRTRTFTTFPENEFVVQIVKAHRDHPTVAAPMRSLAKYWLGATYGWEWLLTYSQLFGSPFRWANYDSDNPQAKAAVCSMLAQSGHASWAAFPSGVELKFIESTQSSGELPQTLVQEIADLQADLIVLGHTQQTKQNVGSKATEVERVGVRSQTAKVIFARIASTLTKQFVRAVCFKNFGNYDYLPEIRCDMPDASITGDEITGLETLQGMGLEIADEWVRDRFGIPSPRAGQKVLKAVLPPPSPTGQKGAQSKTSASYTEAGQNVAISPLLVQTFEQLMASTISDAMSRMVEPANA